MPGRQAQEMIVGPRSSGRLEGCYQLGTQKAFDSVSHPKLAEALLSKGVEMLQIRVPGSGVLCDDIKMQRG
eukprot:9986750-Alexandrium_andersonii.AAC.1